MATNGMKFKISIPGKLEHLVTVSAFLNESLERFGLEKSKIADIQIAVSEACTNVIEHGDTLGETSRIDIFCYFKDDSCVVKIRDFGKQFNPLAVPAPTLNDSLSDREVGGLGVFLMKKLLDELKYEYSTARRCGTLTMVKYS